MKVTSKLRRSRYKNPKAHAVIEEFGLFKNLVCDSYLTDGTEFYLSLSVDDRCYDLTLDRKELQALVDSGARALKNCDAENKPKKR